MSTLPTDVSVAIPCKYCPPMDADASVAGRVLTSAGHLHRQVDCWWAWLGGAAKAESEITESNPVIWT